MVLRQILLVGKIFFSALRKLGVLSKLPGERGGVI